MAFDIELAPEGVVDRLDQLPQRLEQVCSRPLGLALAGWAAAAARSARPRPLELVAVVNVTRWREAA